MLGFSGIEKRYMVPIGVSYTNRESDNSIVWLLGKVFYWARYRAVIEESFLVLACCRD